MPETHVEQLSVGYESVASLVSRNLISTAKPLFIRGEWGSGKSHFVSYVRAFCRRHRVPTAVVALNARGHALNYPQRFYPLIARDLEWGEGPHGLARLLRERMISDEGVDSLERAAGDPSLMPLGVAVQLLCQQRRRTGVPPPPEDVGWTIVVGEDLSWADYAYKRAQATSRVGTLGGLLTRLADRSLVLMFDEAETIDQLWNVRSRLAAYEVLGKLCRFQGVWCIFAITRRFDETVRKDLGSMRWLAEAPSDARWFLRHWADGGFDVVGPPVLRPDGAAELARRIGALYQRGYGGLPAAVPRLGEVLGTWTKDPARNPRILIRMIVHRLDNSRPLATNRETDSSGPSLP